QQLKQTGERVTRSAEEQVVAAAQLARTAHQMRALAQRTTSALTEQARSLESLGGFVQEVASATARTVAGLGEQARGAAERAKADRAGGEGGHRAIESGEGNRDGVRRSGAALRVGHRRDGRAGKGRRVAREGRRGGAGRREAVRASALRTERGRVVAGVGRE